MVTARVNGKAVKIPQRFTVQEWIELQRWDFDAPVQWPHILEQITQIPQETFRNADEESLQLFMGFVISAMNSRQRVELPDFNKLTFGQFVDMDCFIAIGIDKHLESMLEVLEITTPWAPQAIWSLEQYITWRTSIYRRYSTLFGLNDQDFKDYSEEKEDLDPKSVSRGWYNVIVELANNDILKIDRVTEEPVEKVLTYLQVKKEKDIKAAQEARQIRNKQI